jgi:hypothetical protein
MVLLFSLGYEYNNMVPKGFWGYLEVVLDDNVLVDEDVLELVGQFVGVTDTNPLDVASINVPAVVVMIPLGLPSPESSVDTAPEGVTRRRMPLISATT